MADRHRPLFRTVLRFHVSVGENLLGRNPATSTEATIKLKVDGASNIPSAKETGSVNALDGALRKALEGHYPRLKEISLVDYKVTTAAACSGVLIVFDWLR